MDETRELGLAFLQIRRDSYKSAAPMTKQYAPMPIKASNADEGVITGYASKFWVIDSYGEVTAPGCFAQSIKENGPQGTGRIPLRYEHMETVGTHTLMTEDPDGLYIEGYIKDDGACGSMLRNHLSEPFPVSYGLSIGYRNLLTRTATVDDPLIWDTAPKWMKQNPDPAMVMVLQTVKLKENSATVFPANEDAWVDSYRSDLEKSLDGILTATKAGTLTDTQLGLLREIAASLPAVTVPETDQASDLPDGKTDSTDDDLRLLQLTTAIYERLVA